VPGRLYEIRFPDGAFEVDASLQHPPPAVGDTIRRKGKVWKVVSATSDRAPVVVRVELAEQPEGGMLKLRFPDGSVEIRWSNKDLPPVGALVRSRGSLWRVRDYTKETLFLDAASTQDQAQYGPTVKPSPLGEDSVLLETIVEI
jgi:hypothetical protein